MRLRWIAPRVLPALLLVLAVTVLQHHAVRWWTAETLHGWPGWGAGMAWPWMGWGFGAAWEVWNVWSWAEAVPYRRTAAGRGWLASALVTSALLVGGPAYQLTEATVREAAAPLRAEASAGERAQRALVSALAAGAQTYREQGATGNLRRTEAALAVETDKLLALESARAGRAPSHPAPYRWGKPALQAMGVVMLQVAVAVCAVRLFGRGREIRGRWQEHVRERTASAHHVADLPQRVAVPMPPAPPPVVAAVAGAPETARAPAPAPETGFTPRPPDTVAGQELADLLRAEFERRWPDVPAIKRWSSWAVLAAVPASTMSFLRNYEAHVMKRTPGLQGRLDKIRDALWPQDGEAESA